MCLNTNPGGRWRHRGISLLLKPSPLRTAIQRLIPCKAATGLALWRLEAWKHYWPHIWTGFSLIIYYCCITAKPRPGLIYLWLYMLKIVGQGILFYWDYKSPGKNISNHIATTEDAQIGRNIYWQSEMALGGSWWLSKKSSWSKTVRGVPSELPG